MNLLSNVIVAPEFDLVLPSGNKIKFRGYLAKEKKILLMAQEAETQEEQLDLYLQIISNCVTSVPFSAEDLTMADFEYLILNIRGKSVGDPIELDYTCKNVYYDQEDQREKMCNGIIHCEIPLSEIKIINSENLKGDLILDEDLGIGFKFRIPRIREIVKLDSNSELKDSKKMELLLLNAITHFFTKDEMIDTSDKVELSEFIDSLPLYQYDKLQSYTDTLPRMKYSNSVTCPFCGFVHDINLERTKDFLA